MAASSTNARLTNPPRLLSKPRLSPTSVANLRFPAADFSTRFFADSSSPRLRSVPFPVVFSDQRRRRSMEPSNVYVSDSSFSSVFFCCFLFRFYWRRIGNDEFADLSLQINLVLVLDEDFDVSCTTLV